MGAAADPSLPAPSPGRPGPAGAGGPLTWLAIDTATDRASVAIGPDFASAREGFLDGARRHAAAVLPILERLLEEAGIGLSGIRGVLLADGPGSFTGLRVGASLAKALADSRGLPVLTASSLMARAHAADRGEGLPVLVTSDALRGDVYAAVYRFSGGAVETVVAPTVAPRERLATLAPPGSLDGTGNPASARHLIALAALAGGAVPIADVHAWEPIYGRPAEAQARWEATHGRPLSRAPGVAR
ncbi:MAG TPA: tRNA (adenosine(37)-N6)-threonylcarbamoyltransferase complex dimerization subunit type 1 TsaB [Gemmatimonadales bacterium]|nr:tRNA (adenosine(37)-N6)-threonylcarbamoyltransferase complex dimerization subunit type 1 TsaB [Gemmatimonadales bacterium]